MNSEEWLTNFDIKGVKRAQENEFLNKISFCNGKIAKEIIYKYDMKNSCTRKIVDAFGNIDKTREIYENYLKERKKFFELISEYL
jgi:hypothetical protein